MNTLSPPLIAIEASLLEPADELIQGWAEEDETLPQEVVRSLEADPRARARRHDWQTVHCEEIAELPVFKDVPEMPGYLLDMVRQRVAAQTRIPQDKPKAGQILRVEDVVEPGGALVWAFAQPLAVLLDRATDRPEVWAGWIVSHEVNYATEWDLILESGDQPCDPLARMVQVWNPVQVYVPSTATVLANLGMQRMEAIRALAGEYAQHPEPERERALPGSLMDRYLEDRFRLQTGTPLGDDKDPRWRYQELFREAASKITRASTVEVAQPALLAQLLIQLTEAAQRLGESLILRPLVPQALGEKAPKAQIFQLGDVARIEVFPPPGEDTVQVRIEVSGDRPLRAWSSAGERVLQTEAFSNDK